MKHIFVFDSKVFFHQQWKLDAIIDSIRQFFRAQDQSDFSIYISRYRRHAMVLAEKEISKRAPGEIVRIYAVGGEEILFDCTDIAAYLPNIEITSVPYGETNDFLQIFGSKNIELFRDIPSLVRGIVHPTDIIRWDINYALNSCYIGLNPTALKFDSDKHKFFFIYKILSFFNYVKAAFDKGVAAQFYEIRIDDKVFSGSYSLIHIANGPYFAGRKTGAVTAAVNDGFLDVTLIKAATPLKTIGLIRKYLRGKQVKNSISVRAKKIMIWSDVDMLVQIDQEYIKDTSIEVGIVHHALQMVTPDNLFYPLIPEPVS